MNLLVLNQDPKSLSKVNQSETSLSTKSKLSNLKSLLADSTNQKPLTSSQHNKSFQQIRSLKLSFFSTNQKTYHTFNQSEIYKRFHFFFSSSCGFLPIILWISVEVFCISIMGYFWYYWWLKNKSSRNLTYLTIFIILWIPDHPVKLEPLFCRDVTW